MIVAMGIIEQIVCWLFGIILIVAAFRFLVHEKLSFSLVLFLCSIVFFFFGLSGVQGLLKTGLLFKVRNSLITYGEKLDGFQTNVVAMREELASQQAKLFAAQNALFEVQTNIIAQQRKLENVEFLVGDLFSKTQLEYINGKDTNRVAIRNLPTAGMQHLWIKLRYAAFKRSASIVIFYPNENPIIITSPDLALNYVHQIIQGPIDLTACRFEVRYVRDSSVTNLLSKVEFKGTEVYADGNKLSFSSDPDIFRPEIGN